MAGLNFGNVGFVGSLGGGAVVAAPAGLDYTGFAMALSSYTGSNTNMVWQDVSGHGRNATQIGGGFLLTTAVRNGKPGYVTQAGAISDTSFSLASIAATPQDYTIYVALQVNAVTNCYLLLLQDDTAVNGGSGNYTYLGLNTGEVNTYFQRRAGAAYGPNNAVAAGRAVVLTYQFNRAGVTVSVNDTVIASGTPWTPAWFNGGFFGNQSNSRLFDGALFALLARVGNDSAATVAAVRQQLYQDLNITP